MTRKAFTLLEVLMAAALVTILFGSTFFAFSSLRRGLATGKDAFGFQLQATLLERRVVILLSEASPYLEKARKASFDGKKKSLSFTTFRGRQRFGAPRFVSMEASDRGFCIKLDETGWLVDSTDAAKVEQTCFEWIRAVDFAYLDGRTDEWKDEWKLARTGRLPRLVRITINPDLPPSAPSRRNIVVHPMLDRGPSLR